MAPPAFKIWRCGTRRDITGRVGELRRDYAGGAAITEDQIGATAALLARLADPDQGHVGEAVGCRLAPDLAGLLPIGLEDCRGADPAGIEDADHYAARRRLDRAFRAADWCPHRRVRLFGTGAARH